jgi:hypothetical protein
MRRLLSGDRRCKPLQGSAHHDHRPLHPNLPDCIEPEVGSLPGGAEGRPQHDVKMGSESVLRAQLVWAGAVTAKTRLVSTPCATLMRSCKAKQASPWRRS